MSVLISLYNNKSEKSFNYNIAVDGGVNDKTIKYLENSNLTYIVSGSYVCKSQNIEESIRKLL